MSALADSGATFRWQQEYAIGDAQIDAQHEELFELARLLEASLRQNKSSSVIQPALSAIPLLVHVHFRDEEAFFERIGSPLLTQHKALHVRIAEEALWLTNALRQQPPAIAAVRLLDWLETQLLVHIVNADRIAVATAHRQDDAEVSERQGGARKGRVDFSRDRDGG
ncbi:MAG: hemerythrin domain-containing protein [Alphaproteobacteria bacterium]|nr:hemerythrin domain-containing protein [Alphaproteobacteria bacterium]